MSASDRIMARIRSATRSWCSNVSWPITAHCSAVDSSMRVKVAGTSVFVMAPFSHVGTPPTTVGPVDPATLADVELEDADGARHRLGDYWAERPVAFVFLRHFG